MESFIRWFFYFAFVELLGSNERDNITIEASDSIPPRGQGFFFLLFSSFFLCLFFFRWVEHNIWFDVFESFTGG